MMTIPYFFRYSFFALFSGMAWVTSHYPCYAKLRTPPSLLSSTKKILKHFQGSEQSFQIYDTNPGNFEVFCFAFVTISES